MNKNILIILGLFLINITMLSAQSDFEKFCKLINPEKNVIYQNEALLNFFEKLTQLENGEIDRVNILHIGDSHIQADWLSGQTRVELQRVFGNAGRGLVFPYHVAGSNSPSDIYSRSNYPWEAYRNVHNQSAYEMGISGFVIASKDTAAYLKLSLNDKYNMGGYGFNKITIFHPKNDNLSQIQFFTAADRDVIEHNVIEEKNVYYSVKSGDNLGAIADKYNSSVSFIKKENGLKSTMIYPKQRLIVAKEQATISYMSPSLFTPIDIVAVEKNKNSTSYYFDNKMEFIFIKSPNNNSTLMQTQWDGFMLEDTSYSGVLYHTVGVNGAKFKDYNNSVNFYEQSKDLHADLIIVSLGTNESLDKNLSNEDFITEMDLFFKKLRKANSKSSILITTPTDNQKGQQKVEELTFLIKAMALENHIAFYDFYEVLNGIGAFSTLRSNGFAQRDGVHLTAKGYEGQGKLLSDALISAYYKFKQDGDL